MSEFILWSGGLDSTLLLYEKARDNPTELINAVTIPNIANTVQASKQESLARKKLKKKIPFKNIKYHEINIDYNYIDETWTMPIWLCHSIMSIKKDDNLNFSYLSSDGADFWVKRQELINAFNSIMKLRGNTATISFPFEYKTKGYVIEQLKRLKLIKDCWTCGNPKNGKPCNKCMKCISLKRWSAYPEKGDLT